MTHKPLVLIVDDVLENVEVLGNTLADAYEIQFATSGEECLELIGERQPGLILLDVMMPGMSGYEVFSRLKSNSQMAGIPVLFVTATNDANSESEALNAGAVDFIHKPINPDVVRARVRLQFELLQHRRSLERQVLSRTQELATARAEAESANAVKTRFMANVSHEMRTPLQGILGFSQIGRLKSGEASPEKLSSYFQAIEQSGERMRQLVESLLTLTEQAWDEQSGLVGEQVKEIGVREFSEGVVLFMELQAKKRQQALVYLHESRLDCFAGDPIRLRQVMEHLLGNALNYSPEASTVTFRVSDAKLPAPKSLGTVPAISFQIIDNGCGIPESEIKAVFEPFYQSTRTDRGAGGTGLGLPLSRCIVARHGGQISLLNRAEGGVICELVLPIAQP